MPRQTEFCNHYQAMSEHAVCKAGIAYDKFKGLGFAQRPCFERNGIAPGGCDCAVFPTAEERESRDKELNEYFAKIGKARKAIVDFLGGPWNRGDATASGQITCPACGGVEALQFSRSGYNGHIHAHCHTEGCVAWME